MNMTTKRDYYEVLDVDKNASANIIKSQYRKLALKYHPDRNKSKDAAEIFKGISEAYAVLSDEEKKKLYDTYGHSGVDGKYSTEDIFKGASSNFSDVFNDLFGKSGRGGFESIFENLGGFGGFNKKKGSDLLYEISITLEDVYNGKKIELDLNKNIECDECKGSGCYPGTSKIACSSCNGYGQIKHARNMGFSTFVTVEPCRSCSGEGLFIKKPCKICNGKGQKKGIKHIAFNIPTGIDTGDYTIPEEGEISPDGISGDLILRVNILPHTQFKRDNADIFYDEKITMIDATLGKKIIVPTLHGTEKIKINAGSQPNSIIKLKGKGLPHNNSRAYGDQYVRLVVIIPKKLNKQQQHILEQLRDITN